MICTMLVQFKPISVLTQQNKTQTDLHLDPHNQKEFCKLILNQHVIDEALGWKCLGVLNVLGRCNFLIHAIA